MIIMMAAEYYISYIHSRQLNTIKKNEIIEAKKFEVV